jgi:hypothetical protein
MVQKEEWRMQEGRYWREKEGYKNNKRRYNSRKNGGCRKEGIGERRKDI